jgi:glutamate carboxypeptidase
VITSATPCQLRDSATDLSGEALARLEELVMAESPSGDVARLAHAALLLESLYAGVGARIVRDQGPHGDHLVVSWPSADPAGNERGHVLLVGHYDTALPAGATRERPFRLDGDTLTGPGVYDMKGGLVQVELAMRLIQRHGRELRAPVRLVIVNDEEIGSPDGHRVVRAHAHGAAAALGLEPALPGGALKIGRRGVARVELNVTGLESHSGLDAASGVSATDELVDQLVRLRELVPFSAQVSVNVGTISGGARANVVAGRAHAELGLRFSTGEAEGKLLAALNSLSPIRQGARVSTQLLTHRPPWVADPDNPLAAELIARAATMGLDLGHGVSGGAGDTNHLGSAGVPTADGLGPDGGGAHGPDERASLASLLDRAALLADYLAPMATSDRAPAGFSIAEDAR